MEMSHFYGGPTEADTRDLADAVEHTLGHWLMPRGGDNVNVREMLGNVSVKNMVTAGHRAIVTFESAAEVVTRPSLWPSRTLFNTYANKPDVLSMERFNAETVADYNAGKLGPSSSSALFKLSWTLTPDAKTVVEGALPLPPLLHSRVPHSLRDLAAEANPGLVSFVTQALDAGCITLGNILVVDMIHTSDLLKAVMMVNTVRSATRTTTQESLEMAGCEALRRKPPSPPPSPPPPRIRFLRRTWSIISA